MIHVAGSACNAADYSLMHISKQITHTHTHSYLPHMLRAHTGCAARNCKCTAADLFAGY